MENRKRSQRDGGPHIKQSPTKFKQSPSNRNKKMSVKTEDLDNSEWLSDLIADVNNCCLELNSAPESFIQVDADLETLKKEFEQDCFDAPEKPFESTPLVDDWTFFNDFGSYSDQTTLMGDFDDSLYDEWHIGDDVSGLYENWVDIFTEEDDLYEVDMRSDWKYESIDYDFFEIGRETAVYEDFFTDAAKLNFSLANGFDDQIENDFKNAFLLDNTVDVENFSPLCDDSELSEYLGFNFPQSEDEYFDDVASTFDYEIGSEWELDGEPIYDILELESGFSDDGCLINWEEYEGICSIEF